MNLDTHIRDIWIATGVLSVAGILLAFFRTTGWQSRSGKYVIDLGVSEDSPGSERIVLIVTVDHR
jgi:hypothetical protein